MAMLTFNFDEARASLILARAVFLVPDLMEVIEIYREGGLNNRQIVQRIADAINQIDAERAAQEGK